MIIITICKDDPEGLLKTHDSIITAISKGVVISLWVIKLSNKSDISLSYIESLPAFTVVSMDADSSIYDALNQAIRMIPNEYNLDYTMLLHARDEIVDLSIQDCMQINTEFEKNDFDILIANGKTSSHKVIRALPKIVGVGGLNFCHQSAFFRVSLLKEYPFPLCYPIAGDYGQFLSMKEIKINYLDMSVVLFDVNGVSSHSVWRTRKDNFKAGFSIYGILEVFRLLYMLSYRFVSKWM